MRATSKVIATILSLNLLLFFVFLLTRHYPPLLMFLHIVSLVALWCYLLRGVKVVPFLATKWKEIVLIAVLVVAALGIRLYRVEELPPGMYSDELTVARYSLKLLNEPEWPPFIGLYAHPTPLLYLTAGSLQAFGHTMTAIRLPSIVFGALVVAVFYILLRLFFPVGLSAAGSLLMVFQYTDIVLSRLAYEPTPSLFFQIVTAIFLILYQRTKDNRYLIGTALSVGAGLYTYYNFRTFALVICALTLFLILRKGWRRYWHDAALFSAIVFVAAMPLLSFALADPAGFMGREAAISVFSRHYSFVELVKELWGNIYRTALLPFVGMPGMSTPYAGDQNPGKNPGATTIFNPLTTILAILGFVYLFRKKRALFWLLWLMYLPAFSSDIFSSEVIPDFHYYGLGHPNALRVSGIIGVILFAATFGISRVYQWTSKRKAVYGTIAVVVILCLNSLGNWLSYFNQEKSALGMYYYNYKANHADLIQLVNYLNNSPAGNISVTQSLASGGEWGYVGFFLNPTKKLSSFEPISTSSALMVVKASDITAFDINGNTVPIVNGVLASGIESAGYTMHPINDPQNGPDIVLFEKLVYHNSNFLRQE